MNDSTVFRRDQHGVLLTYPDPSVKRPFHCDETPHISDRERALFVRAEHALRLLSTVVECMELDDIARIDRALDVLRSALDVERERMVMAPES